MTRTETAERLSDALLAFVERAAKEGATTEEVRALPEVAHVLSELVINFF
jgi:hypothetical protein